MKISALLVAALLVLTSITGAAYAGGPRQGLGMGGMMMPPPMALKKQRGLVSKIVRGVGKTILVGAVVGGVAVGGLSYANRTGHPPHSILNALHITHSSATPGPGPGTSSSPPMVENH